jgi:hypothetical protein
MESKSNFMSHLACYVIRWHKMIVIGGRDAGNPESIGVSEHCHQNANERYDSVQKTQSQKLEPAH